MKLNGKVTKVESASEFVDGQQRIIVTVTEATGMFHCLQLRNDGFNLDDELDIEITLKPTPDYSDVPFMQAENVKTIPA